MPFRFGGYRDDDDYRRERDMKRAQRDAKERARAEKRWMKGLIYGAWIGLLAIALGLLLWATTHVNPSISTLNRSSEEGNTDLDALNMTVQMQQTEISNNMIAIQAILEEYGTNDTVLSSLSANVPSGFYTVDTGPDLSIPGSPAIIGPTVPVEAQLVQRTVAGRNFNFVEAGLEPFSLPPKDCGGPCGSDAVRFFILASSSAPLVGSIINPMQFPLVSVTGGGVVEELANFTAVPDCTPTCRINTVDGVITQTPVSIFFFRIRMIDVPDGTVITWNTKLSLLLPLQFDLELE